MIYIIILGNSKEPVRRLRVNEAFKHYRRFLLSDQPCQLIFSGGGGTFPSEAEVMYDYALNLGVDPNDCIIENNSRTTVENLGFTRNILESLDLVGSQSFIICTSTFHIPRSFTIATFMLGHLGTVKAIHTNEQVTPQQQASELKAVFAFVSEVVRLNTL